MTRTAHLPLRSLLTAILLVGACISCAEDGKGKTYKAAGGPTVRDLTVAGRTVSIELAVTPTSRNQGLMHRTALETDAGMLFIFVDDKPRTFWMRNTLIPLDIIFLDADGTVQNIEQGQPMAEVPGYHSLRAARMVLELEAGWSAEHGLKAGDRIDVPGGWLELPEA
jgi:hypothetical protein